MNLEVWYNLYYGGRFGVYGLYVICNFLCEW